MELINPRKAVRNPSDFYDGIAKRQAELIQKQHEELTKQARMNSMNAVRRSEFSSAPDESTRILYVTHEVARQKRKSLWDSTIKADQEKNKALYVYYKSRKTDVEDFLYNFILFFFEKI